MIRILIADDHAIVRQGLKQTVADEYQVMCMIAAGKTLREIADELSLSEKTFGTYRMRVLEKMEMLRNAELIHYALKNKLIE